MPQLLGPCLGPITWAFPKMILIFLVFRSMQRLKHSMPGVSLVLDTIVKTVPEISYMLLLWFFISILFISFGCSFFVDVPHLQSSFLNFPEGLWTSFVILTQDGWRRKFERRRFLEGYKLLYKIGPLNNFFKRCE